MKHFNQLTPAEAERLALLAEECAEVIQIVGKILRHGYESYHPADSLRTTNRELLGKELGHVGVAEGLLYDANDVVPQLVIDEREKKRDRIQQYLHHANVNT